MARAARHSFVAPVSRGLKGRSEPGQPSAVRDVGRLRPRLEGELGQDGRRRSHRSAPDWWPAARRSGRPMAAEHGAAGQIRSMDHRCVICARSFLAQHAQVIGCQRLAAGGEAFVALGSSLGAGLAGRNACRSRVLPRAQLAGGRRARDVGRADAAPRHRLPQPGFPAAALRHVGARRRSPRGYGAGPTGSGQPARPAGRPACGMRSARSHAPAERGGGKRLVGYRSGQRSCRSPPSAHRI